MASDSRNQVQQTRLRQVRLLFQLYRRAARRAPTEEATPQMQQMEKRIWELHHALTLNEGW